MTKSRFLQARPYAAVAAGLTGLALLLCLASGLLSVPPGQARPAGTAAPAAAPDGVRQVKAGVAVRSLGPVDPAASTFAVTFDLWLVTAQPFRASDLVFPDAVRPVVLGQPVAERSVGASRYQLFSVAGEFRYEAGVADLVAERVPLQIRLLDTAAPRTDLVFVPDQGGSRLTPQDRNGRPMATVDGGWSVTDTVLLETASSRDTLGDPAYGAPEVSYSGLIATIMLVPGAMGIDALAQRIVPPVLALPVCILLLLVLAGIAFPGRSRPDPGPWRAVAILGTLTLLLSALERLAGQVVGGFAPSQVQYVLLVLHAAWLALAAAWLVTLMPVLIWGPLERRSGAPASALERMAVNVVIVLAAVLTFLTGSLNLSAASVGAASGVLTLVLGLALQSLILDLFSGILLNLERPFRLLNWVTVQTSGSGMISGQVRNMNWRTTQLQTRDNDLVSVPNSVMARASVTNHANPSTSSRLRIDFVLNAGVAPQLARTVMKAGAMQSVHAGLVDAQPPPTVVVVGPTDYGVTYRVRFYVNLNMASGSRSRGSVAENVLTALAEAGLHIAIRDMPDAVPDVESDPAAGLAIAPVPFKPQLHAVPTAPTAVPAGILDSQDIERIRSSWAQAATLGGQVADLFYDRLFAIDPPLRKLFRSDPAAQRKKLLSMLSMLVKGLDHPEQTIDTLADLGLRHLTYGVKLADYDSVGAALLWTLEKGLGDAFDAPTRGAWTALYGSISTVMAKAAGQKAA